MIASVRILDSISDLPIEETSLEARLGFCRSRCVVSSRQIDGAFRLNFR